MTGAQSRSRRQLLLLAALFLLPVLVSGWLYFSGGWRPAAVAISGVLIAPPRPLPDAALALDLGAPASHDILRQRWSLVYLGPGECGEACIAALAAMRQVHAALDKDAGRLQRVWLRTGPCCAQAGIADAGPGLLIVTAAGPGAEGLLAVLAEAGAPGGIHVVDPLGNLMLRYPPGVPARSVLKDLERLLRLSQIG